MKGSTAAAAGIGQIFYGPSLETLFNLGGLPPNGDPRTSDIIIQPNVGVVYTGSSKQAEHGGFAHDNTNVIMLVSNPSFQASTVTGFVETATNKMGGQFSECLSPNPLGESSLPIPHEMVIPTWPRNAYSPKGLAGFRQDRQQSEVD